MSKLNRFNRLCVSGLLLASSAITIPVFAEGAGQVDQLIIHYHSEAQARMNRSADPQLMARISEHYVAEATGLQVSYKRAMAKVSGAHVLHLPYEMDVEQAQIYAGQLAENQPDIDYAEPDYRRYPLSTTPNDPQLNQQWHLMSPAEYRGAANVFNAWSLTKGSSDIVVAVLDSGVTNHVDLLPNFVGGSAENSGYDMVTDDPSGVYPSGDGDGRDSDPSDPCTFSAEGEGGYCLHGTHVAGLIAALPDNGKFVAGVGWNTSLSTVRFLGEKAGYLSDEVDSMYWASGEEVVGAPNNPSPANIINLSVGTDGYDCSITEQNAINSLRKKGISIVVAAGNKNHDVKGAAPANCDGVISVTGVMEDGSRAPFANYGELNDVAAPANNIVSIFNPDEVTAAMNTGEPNSNAGIKAISGVSQAAPLVSGVLALMLAANDKLLDESIVPISELPDILERKLKRAARPFPENAGMSDDPNGCNENQETSCVCTTDTCGAGLLDAMRAVKSVSTAPVANTGSDRNVGAGSMVALDGSSSSDDEFGGEIVSYHWEQMSGPSVTLTDADKAKATFTAPNAEGSDTQLSFRLTVTDDVGLQGDERVVITVPKSGGGGGSIPLSGLLGLLGLFGLRRLVR